MLMHSQSQPNSSDTAAASVCCDDIIRATTGIIDEPDRSLPQQQRHVHRLPMSAGLQQSDTAGCVGDVVGSTSSSSSSNSNGSLRPRRPPGLPAASTTTSNNLNNLNNLNNGSLVNNNRKHRVSVVNLDKNRIRQSSSRRLLPRPLSLPSGFNLMRTFGKLSESNDSSGDSHGNSAVRSRNSTAPVVDIALIKQLEDDIYNNSKEMDRTQAKRCLRGANCPNCGNNSGDMKNDDASNLRVKPTQRIDRQSFRSGDTNATRKSITDQASMLLDAWQTDPVLLKYAKPDVSKVEDLYSVPSKIKIPIVSETAADAEDVKGTQSMIIIDNSSFHPTVMKYDIKSQPCVQIVHPNHPRKPDPPPTKPQPNSNIFQLCLGRNPTPIAKTSSDAHISTASSAAKVESPHQQPPQPPPRKLSKFKRFILQRRSLNLSPTERAVCNDPLQPSSACQPPQQHPTSASWQIPPVITSETSEPPPTGSESSGNGNHRSGVHSSGFNSAASISSASSNGDGSSAGRSARIVSAVVVPSQLKSNKYALMTTSTTTTATASSSSASLCASASSTATSSASASANVPQQPTPPPPPPTHQSDVRRQRRWMTKNTIDSDSATLLSTATAAGSRQWRSDDDIYSTLVIGERRCVDSDATNDLGLELERMQRQLDQLSADLAEKRRQLLDEQQQQQRPAAVATVMAPTMVPTSVQPVLKKRSPSMLQLLGQTSSKRHSIGSPTDVVKTWVYRRR